MSSTLASVSFCRFVVGSEKQELSVSPAGCPTHLSLCGQRKVGQRKATPRPRPLRIPAQRVRVSRSGFSDRPSLACRKPCPHPCGQPCGRFDRLPPLPRGPFKSAGSCPQKLEQEQEQEPSRDAWRGNDGPLRPALTPTPLPQGEGLKRSQRLGRGEPRATVGRGPPYGLLHYPTASCETSATARKRSERRLSRARRLPRTLGSSAITITASKKPSTLGRSWARRISTPT